MDYNTSYHPIMVIKGNSEAAKEFDRPQDFSKKPEAIKKARKNLKKIGFFKTFR